MGYTAERRTGFYLCRRAAIPATSRQKAPRDGQRRFERIARKYGYKCIQCHIVCPFLTIVHIIPKVHGGTHDDSNLQLLCLSCHRIKNFRNMNKSINSVSAIHSIIS